MLVMHLLSSLGVQGAPHDEVRDDNERAILGILTGLSNAGHKAIVVSSEEETHPIAKKLIKDGHRYARIQMPKKAMRAVLAVLPLQALIESARPDIIQVHSRTCAWILHWALKTTKDGFLRTHAPKILGTVYGFYPNDTYSRALLHHVDCVIAASTSIKAHLTAFDTAPICLVRRGVPTRDYPYRHIPSVHWMQGALAAYPALIHKKWLLFAHPLTQDNGADWLIDILGNLSNLDIHLIICDEETQEDNLVHEQFCQRAYALDLSDKVSFIGQDPPDLREWISSCDLMLALAKRPQSIGMQVIKAIHLGTPVIGFDKGAYQTILGECFLAGLVMHEDARTLCTTIARQLKTKTRPKMTKAYTLSLMVDRTLALYACLSKEGELDIAERLAALDKNA